MSEAAGEWLKSELDRQGLTVRDVTEATGLKATQTVYAWLHGKAAPNDTVVEKLADLLGIPVIEVRRRFGLWVPEDGGATSTLDKARLRKALNRFRQAADDLEHLLGEDA